MAKMKNKVKTNNAKSIITGVLFLLIFAAMIAGILFAYELQAREIEVVGCNGDILIGSQITEDQLKSMTILKKSYDDHANTTWTDSHGNQHTGQTYVLWEDRNDPEKGVVGKYAVNAGNADDYFTYRDFQAERVETNPWYADVPDGSELYTLNFDNSDVYTRMLIPGSELRMRIITQVPVDKADEYRREIQNKTGVSEGVEGEATNGYLSAILPFYTTDEESRENNTVPVAEVVFNNLTLLDALNSESTSIYDLFYSLTNMENSVRAKYIAENYTTLRSQIIPQTLILVLKPEEASQVAEFENIEYNAYKFTVVKHTTTDELYTKFSDIAATINQIHINTSSES